MKTLTAVLSGIIIAGSAFSAMAETTTTAPKHHRDPAKMQEKMLAKLDTNKNGSISKEEFLANTEKRFAEMDTDGNGSVSKEELEAHHTAKIEKFKAKREAQKTGVAE
ncbi:MAG: hypothetical protein K0R63_21 [Rickettsiales bacterium]|jgi:Ca2+-binding EF-hand superfamily protein|nr:hypothetical protein [Rickettsiales bacterium]